MYVLWTTEQLRSKLKSPSWDLIKRSRWPPNCKNQWMATVWPLNHRKSTNQEPQKGTIKRSRTPIRNLDLSHKHFNRRHMTTHNLMRQEIHEGRRRRHLVTPLVSQTIPFTARRRVWSCCNYWVVAKERNCRPLQLGNKMLTSAKHMM